jgi:hypothetical protein
MIGQILAFQPWTAATVNIAATSGANSQVTLPTLGAAPGGPVVPDCCQVYNAHATVISFVSIKTNATGTASATTDMPVPPGALLVIGIPQGATTANAITSGAGGGPIYFTLGVGV